MGFSSVALIQLKIVLFAPMPRARVRMATTAKLGDFRSMRRP
jgi:hypothetical protein